MFSSYDEKSKLRISIFSFYSSDFFTDHYRTVKCSGFLIRHGVTQMPANKERYWNALTLLSPAMDT